MVKISPDLLNRRVNEARFFFFFGGVQSKPFANLLDGSWFLVSLHGVGGKECMFSGPTSGERLPGEKPCQGYSPQTLTFAPGDFKTKEPFVSR